MPMTTLPPRTRPRDAGSRAGYAWHEFDSAYYLKENYAFARDEDRQFAGVMRDFFADAVPRDKGLPAEGLRGVDVGSGTNLYPALAMLPFCNDITLAEYAEPNIEWLNDEKADFSATWDPFWGVYEENERYADPRIVGDPRAALDRAAHVERYSVFQLPEAEWQIGTMFFVAESITTEAEEFHAALHGFVGSLRAGAPFAAAFMENSNGYTVGGNEYPAVKVRIADVERCLGGTADIRKTSRVGKGDDPLRDGYTGMFLVCGIKL